MKKYGQGFHCFSPPVMLATFVLETGLLIYTVIRHRMTTPVRIIVATLFFLALFQLAEYNVCGGFGASAATWSRIGFVAITFLPALGMHLLQKISGRGWKAITWIAYATAVIWATLFIFGERAFSGHVCAGNYIIFQLKPVLSGYYYGYYYGWLTLGIFMCAYFARTAQKHIREALILQALGYVVFLLPTTVLNSLKPETVSGIPSIMCGFAILYALILVFGVLPLFRDKNVASHRKKR